MGDGRQKVKEHLNGKADPAGPDRPPPPRHTAKDLAIVYDLTRGIYFYANGETNWQPWKEAQLARLLRSKGYVRDVKADNSLSYLENKLLEIQLHNHVPYAGELAGYEPGLHDICGNRVLITRGPRLPEAKAGTWTTLGAFFAQLFGEHKAHFFGWLKCARQALKAGAPWRPGQILILAGPAGCGKNLLQSIVTEILGGRVGKPYRYMTGETSFNKDLLTSEHLVIQDEAPLADHKARRFFGARIKDFCVNEVQSFHAKGYDAMTLTPFWRLSISLNEEVENLQILPPLDDNLRDKLLLFRCGNTRLPFDGGDPVRRRLFREKLSREIPGFLYALGRWRIPERLKDQRYGVCAYLDSSLVAEIDSLSPELKLWSLIQSAGFIPRSAAGWVGSATEVETLLRDKWPRESDKLLTWSTACGVYLQKLSQKFPERIRAQRGEDNTRNWLLLPASSTAARNGD